MGGEVFSICWNFVAGTGAGCVLVTLKIVHRMNMVRPLASLFSWYGEPVELAIGLYYVVGLMNGQCRLLM
ncbi:hypothetical protein DY000_02013427 [Brassica cretica]|uniref:Uncharacterized protein n=1 Tax=Brassica cretica TaxID=69181 RepID=A0ABQ7D3V6_BRACR|nr:hypothetical protein DY000_02013427 [Brassica cretica]